MGSGKYPGGMNQRQAGGSEAQRQGDRKDRLISVKLRNQDGKNEERGGFVS